MNTKTKAAAAIAITAWLGITFPAHAQGQTTGYGEHTGSVVFAEGPSDAAKLVGRDHLPAPKADVDIQRAQFTQTDGLLTLDLDLRQLSRGTVDKLVVDFDTDGDARPDQRLQWDGRSATAVLADVSASGSGSTTIDCAVPVVVADRASDRVHIVADRTCLPIVQPAGPGQVELHANVSHLQATVYDHLHLANGGSNNARATWDFLGGKHLMVVVPF